MKPPSLARALEKISSDRRRAVIHQRMSWVWVLLAGALLVYLLGGKFLGWNSPFFVWAVIGVGIVSWVAVRRSVKSQAVSLLDIAREVEAGDARLNSLLLAAYEEQQRAGSEGLSYLQERVVLEALEANRRSPWGQQFAERRFFKAVRHATSMAIFVLAVFLVFVAGPAGSALGMLLGGVTVNPGTTAVERGTALAIMAKFPEPAPPEVKLLVVPKAGPVRVMPMDRALQDPVFGASFPDVQDDFSYHVEYKGKKTAEYKITVFEYPTLKRADVQLKYPEYTGFTEKKIDDTRRVSAVEGTKIDYRLELNKPVKSAALVSKTGETVPLVKDEKFPHVYHAKIDLQESQKLALRLKDEDGRTNKMAHEFAFEALPNKTPDMKIVFPRGDQRVSAIEEVSLQAEVRDDFGLGDFGIAYSMGGDEPKFVKLGGKGNANEKKALAHLLKIEELKAEPDQLVSYFAWAEDLGPDGKTRRTESEMFFAEVRPFEEIFRKGDGGQQQQQQEQGGQQGQQSPSEQLGELQKQIINATWKLQRQEAGKSKVSPKFKDDVNVVKESQDKAITMVNRLLERVEDPKIRGFAQSAATEMKKAAEKLADSSSKRSPQPLPEALSAERAAYQALLRLQAREYSVSRQRQPGGGGGGAQQRAQRQLDELDMEEEKNRYETQSQASAQKTQEQQEQSDALNRLKELSRRQEDISERLKELQAALQEAKTEEEKEELRRRLKRLREEQQDAVQDMDELQQRMAQSQNQSQMADAQKQLEQARSQAQKASEQVQENSLGQAASSSARTENDLKKLTEDFKKATAQQFNDTMRDMRRDARELAEKEKEIADKMEELKTPKQRTLGDSGEKEELARQLSQQKTNYNNILERMKKVSQEAEANEPLLSEKLYDTVRQLNQQNTEQALDNASELLRRSFIPQATQMEEKARKNIDTLRAGVDQAADKLLGDEAEALRMAARQLDELTRRLQNEAPAAIAGNGTNQVAGVGRGTNSLNRAQFSPMPNATNQMAGGRGQRGGQQPGDEQQAQQGENGQQQGEGQREGEQSERRTAQNSTQRGQQGERGQQQGERGQNGEQGQNGQGDRNSEQQQQQQASNSQEGNQQGEGRGGGNRNQASNQQQRFFEQGGNNTDTGGTRTGPTAGERPITGNNFREWADRMREVQEMIDEPDLRGQVAQALDRARALRADFYRHSKGPEWNLLQSQVIKPLTEVRQRLAEELARRDASQVAPLDRDPVPGRYAELVSRYYQSLGQGAAVPKEKTPAAP